MDSSASGSDGSTGVQLIRLKNNNRFNLNSSNGSKRNSRESVRNAKETSGSESDTEGGSFDNVNYLKKMCTGFVGTMKKKNDRISFYKNMAFSRNLELVRMDSEYQRKLRALSFLRGNKDGQQNNEHKYEGNDPLNVFPEEVWTGLLSKFFTDAKDLISLSQTCKLFEEILNKTKNQWLFHKVFPIFLDYLSKSDILKIRLVCKNWLCATDNLVENLMQDKMKGRNILYKKFRFNYNILLPFPVIAEPQLRAHETSINLYKNKFCDAMYLHETNPFIGRSISFKIEPENDNFVNLHDFLTQAKFFLEQVGSHIYHLSISSQCGVVTASVLWHFIRLISKMCGNLRSLHISGVLDCRGRNTGNISLPELPENVSKLPQLKNLTIDLYNVRLAHIQDKLAEIFSKTLTRFEVQMWGDKNSDRFDWGNLRELQVNTARNYNLLENLENTREMGNLRKLSICLNAQGDFQHLERIVMLTNHFKMLSHLVLKFENEGAHICRESLSPDLLAGNNLKTLELEFKTSNFVSYDFLCNFLYLKKLTITFEHVNRRMDTSNEKNNDGVLNIGKYLAAFSLDQCSWNLARNIYKKSNIWNFLPGLKNFRVISCAFNPAAEHVFTRQKYEFYGGHGID